MNSPSDPWQQTEFVAFDLETTGLDPVTCRIVEIGAVRFRGDGVVLGQFEQLVDPRSPIPNSATQIHGISDDDVAGQPTIGEVLPRFVEFLGNRPAILMAHNAAFDVGFLSAESSRQRYQLPRHPVLDTCSFARRRLRLVNYKLGTLRRHYRLIHLENHRAIGDARVLMEVFLRLIRERPAVKSEEELRTCAPTLFFQDVTTTLAHPPDGFEELWEAIAEERPVVMIYMGGTTPGRPRVITPRGVIRLRGQLYLSALCHQSQCEKTFRLDRIAKYHKTET